LIQYETNCPLLVATPERGILMPGEQISLSLLLDGLSSSLLSLYGWTVLKRGQNHSERFTESVVSFAV